MRILVFDTECVLQDSRYPIKDAFEDLGHRVDMFDWSYYFPRHTDSSFISKITSRLFEKIYVDNINSHICSAVGKVRYDLVLIVMGKYILPETLRYAREKSGCIVNWNSDDIFNLYSSSNNVIESVSLYDAHFTPRPHLIDEYKAHGAKEVIPIDWYYRPGFLKNDNDTSVNNQMYDVSFVGSWSNHRESMLTGLSDNGLHVFGWGWKKKAKLKKEKLHASVSIAQMHEVYCNSGINVNLLTIENRDVSNLRNYEIPAVMGFQLAERSDVVKNKFIEDKEIVLFSDKEELISKFLFYTKRPEIRRKIALAGYTRLVKSNYSLKSQLKIIENFSQG